MRALSRLFTHKLDLRFEHQGVRRPVRERRLLASLAAWGQHVPTVVVVVRDKPDRHLAIDYLQHCLEMIGAAV